MSSTALFRTDADIARQRLERTGTAAIETSLGQVQLRITSNLGSVEAVWEALQAIAPCTGAQTFGWAEAWARHVLGPAGDEPVIVVGSSPDGQVRFLWPFETATRAGIKLLRWLGQDHSNYNLGLFEPEAGNRLTAGDLSRLLGAVGRRTGAAAALLEAQPLELDGRANAFAQLPHQRAPSSGYAVRLGDFARIYEDRFSNRSRRILKNKEKKLAAAGQLSYGWAETRGEKLHVLETFFAQKARQFAEAGIKDIFDAHARAFYRDVALLEGDNPGRLRLGYLKLDEEILATFFGTIGHGRLLLAMCSLTGSDWQRQSPGALLIRHQIEEACAAGLAFYDFGAGHGAHKEPWADLTIPLFDSFIVLKPQGLCLTLPLAAKARLKRSIKSNSRLWGLAKTLRARLLGGG